MNPLIEQLNHWGDWFLQFAWPMLWQSSLLILVLFALDLVLRRKVRASVRYALWLLVVLKLLVPPTLALPTSIAWWIRPASVAKSPANQFVVTYSVAESLPTVPQVHATVVVQPTEPVAIPLTAKGWWLVASTVISLGLLTWMMRRWWQVARMVRRATPASASLLELMSDTRQNLGLRRGMRLRLTDQPMSPAVCGLFRPVILLPRPLAEQLPANQLRAVLLHELVHLKRGDVWGNCVQALVQIAYWWHPLLWLANARIRRVREEAVDDAVIVALREEAESYAPTLLEVAKLAFRRPLATLGLVGIMESRNSLRQRIERIVDFYPPPRAGSKVASAVFVLAFAALAVPMEKAPQRKVFTTDRTDELDATLPQAKIGWRPYFAEHNHVQLDSLEQLAGSNASLTPTKGISADEGDKSTNLFVRTYKVDPNTFCKELESFGPDAQVRTNAALAMRAFLNSLGVDLNPESGRSIFFKDRTGLLLVRATLQDLDVIEAAIQMLNTTPPQVNIKAKFVEVSAKDAERLLNMVFTNTPAGGTNGFTGILTRPQADKLMAAITATKGAEVVSVPEVTTLSGRQAQIQSVDIRTIVTGVTPIVTNGVIGMLPRTDALPFGSVLDVIPQVSADGYTVSMTLVPSVTEFVGYDDPKLIPGQPVEDISTQTLLPLPRIRVRQITATAKVWDGQTLVLANFPVKDVFKRPDGTEATKDVSAKSQAQLLVFVTPTLVDQGGNRLHAEEELPFAYEAIPPQKAVK